MQFEIIHQPTFTHPILNPTQIIKLPAILPGDLDLAMVNQQLRDRTAQLDWSAVISAAENHLAVLLAGLDLSHHADVLDLEESTLSETIAGKVVQVLQKIEPEELRILSSSIPSHYQIRAELEQAVLADLLGPAGGEYEEIDEAQVSDRYLVGLLAPLHRRNRPNQSDDQLAQTAELAAAKTGTVDEGIEQLDELAVGSTGTIDDGATETTNPAIETMFPSSMGMSFCVSGTAQAICVKVGWGQYERTKSENLETPTGAPKTVWRRYPVVGQSPPIALAAGGIDPWRIDPDREVYVRGQIRACGEDWIISLFLV